MKKLFACLSIAAIALLVLGLGIQLIPYGRDHTNPPVVANAPWPNPEAEALARRACYDCHSNESVWPWYSRIAPVSWLVQRDVNKGRAELNFSTWGQGEQEIDDAAEVVLEGEMPPRFYLPAHPEARLTAAEKDTLARALVALGADPINGDDD